MTERITVGGLKVARELYELVANEIAAGLDVDAEDVWINLGKIVRDLGSENKRLLDERDRLQRQIDQWLLSNASRPIDPEQSAAFLRGIGYLGDDAEDFQVTTQHVDPEIAQIAGPQLVVPVDNARYALNAANARWGSLYDALYGTDVISEQDGAARGADYNPVRGAKVVAYVEELLDAHVPLEDGSYSDAKEYLIVERDRKRELVVVQQNGASAPLVDPGQFVGYRQSEGRLSHLLLQNHGLHIELQIDRRHPVGRSHPAGLKDVVLESAVTTIQDCEDSVSAVDAEDKARVYRNWYELMTGSLEAEFEKGGARVARRLNADRDYSDPEGGTLTLPGRSLLLVRNVGMHMYTDAVTTEAGEPIPEGFLDAMITSLAALHDLRAEGRYRNSKTGSVYIVKPKMHGPSEVAATVTLFSRVEDALGMPRNTLKIGIMDEERRTTVNLRQCIYEARDRIVFINTGFLDRTGDEIHTHMQAGSMMPKMEIKDSTWMLAYEDWNVDVGNLVGLPGRGQIGKGMWTTPDRMREMVERKVGHPLAGASTAWVPSPTAATLHAIHYHEVDVPRRQRELSSRPMAKLHDILTPPLLGERKLTAEQIQRELENNAQGILGYVVRWVDQGIGCSKVPDIHDVGLMEDRATLRISSQHIANWLFHGLTDREQVIRVMERMAAIVDRQNAGDPDYRAMAPNFTKSIAFQAALDLVLCGCSEPNGYTERVLTKRRREVKSARATAGSMG